MTDIPNIGRLYHSIVVEYYTVEKQENGEDLKLWVEYAAVNAAADVKALTEVEDGEQLSGNDKVDFTVRSISGINRKMRIVWNDAVYNILGVNPITRRYQLIKTEHSITDSDEYLAQAAATADSGTITADKSLK